jgi:hypothetical protein
MITEQGQLRYKEILRIIHIDDDFEIHSFMGASCLKRKSGK